MKSSKFFCSHVFMFALCRQRMNFEHCVQWGWMKEIFWSITTCKISSTLIDSARLTLWSRKSLYTIQFLSNGALLLQIPPWKCCLWQRAHARTHAHTRARARAHTHTHTHTHTHMMQANAYNNVHGTYPVCLMELNKVFKLLIFRYQKQHSITWPYSICHSDGEVSHI